MLNFGLGKTGTSHQLAWYQKEGRKYHLDYVILGFLAANDFGDNWGGVFSLSGDRLVHNPTAYSSIRKIQAIVNMIPFYKWLAGNSHLVNLMRKTATIIDDKLRRARTMGQHLDNESPQKQSTQDHKQDLYNLSLQLVKELRNEVLQDNSQFIFVNIAAKNQKPLGEYSVQDDVKLYVRLDDMLLKDLRRLDVVVVDLVPMFAQLPVSEYYFEHDGHLNPHGHQKVAQIIFEAILPRVSQK